ncbi:MAG TPA: cell division protein FtsL [Gammaproteobacteria bacterium]|nr:cell division protein FtsL [Gammaproteobacteria bacterium]
MVFHALLACLLLLSSVALVYVQHRHRALYVELQSLERERDSLEVEWGKLQLEQSTWATHERIESLARKRLGLRVPPISETVLVRP